MNIQVLDKGFVRLVETWGGGDEQHKPEYDGNEENEAGIIEAARQSTQGNFRGWNIWHCLDCGYNFNEKTNHDKLGGYGPSNKENYPGVDYCENSGFSNDAKLLKYLFSNKPPHSTPFEFGGMTIEVKAPIFVFREWQRHRVMSYNEMSARYSPLPDENYIPDISRLFLTQEKNKQAQAIKGSQILTTDEAELWLNQLEDVYNQAEHLYQKGLTIGLPKEVARVILPVGRYSQMRVTANLLNWYKFLTLRMHPNAQWEIRQYANAVGKIIETQFPQTWKLFAEKEGY